MSWFLVQAEGFDMIAPGDLPSQTIINSCFPDAHHWRSGKVFRRRSNGVRVHYRGSCIKCK